MSELRLPITEHGRLAQAGAAEDRYRLGEEIARGGMGVVYRARDEVLGREVAVKLLLAPPGERPDLVRRFVQEARITGRLQHPGIPPVYELGWLTDGRPFLALKLIHGQTLAAILAGPRDPAADREALLTAFERVCDTVAYAHAERIVHRDLKPANVMVGAFGEVQVVDWGLARGLDDDGPEDCPPPAGWDRSPPLITDPKHLLGTPAYMAPERVRGERGDERCDVFGLGAILCEILTGRPPYEEPREPVLDRVLVGNPAGGLGGLKGCGADPRLIELASACLSADSAGRPADAAAIARELGAHREWVAGRLQAGERAQAAEAARRGRRRLIGLTGTLIVALACLGWGLHRAEQRRAADAEAQKKKHDQVAADALQFADAALRRGHWGRAARVLELAATQLPTCEARDGVVRLLAEAHLANELEAVRLRGRLLHIGDRMIGPDPREYEETFLRHGWDFRGGDAAGLTAHVRESEVRQEAFNALYGWLVAEKPGPTRERLEAVLDGSDDDPWRRRLRAELRRADPDALRQLAADLPAGPQPRALIAELARRLNLDRGGLRLRREAQRRAPDDFWSNHELAVELAASAAHTDEALGYARVAVALRPEEPTAWNNLGVLLLRRRDYGDACKALERATSLGPKLALARVNYGTALLRSGRRAEAETECASGLEGVQGYAPAHLLDGLLGLAGGDDARASRAFRRALELDPRLVAARIKLALLEARSGDPASARERLDEGLKHGEDAALLSAKAVLLLRDGDLTGARRAAERAALLDPHDPLARTTWAAALDDEGDAPGALAQAGEALRRDPGSLTAVLGLTLFRDPPTVRLSLDRLSEEVVHLHPNRAESWALRGLALYQRRKGAEADAACRRALAIDGRLGAAHLVRGLALELLGREDAALSSYRLAQGHSPDDPRPLMAMGTLRLVRGEHDLARSCFRLLEKADPPGSVLGLAEVEMARRGWSAATALLDGGLRRWPGEPRLLNARGLVAWQTGRTADARVRFEEALGRDPGLTVARVNLGRLLLSLGRKTDGLVALRRACELAPADALARLNLGRGLANAGEPREAEGVLREALQRDDTRLDTHLALAAVLSALGRDGEAESLLSPLAAARPREAGLQRLYGEVLLRSHRYREAVAPLERAGAADLLDRARRMARLYGKLDAVLRGEERPDPGEVMDLAGVCAWGRGSPGPAAELLAAFLGAGPLAATDPRRGWHLRAALIAVRAAESREGAARWRREALTWLDRERRAWERLDGEGGLEAGEARKALGAWLTHPGLAAVRDEATLDRLPAEEAAAWRGLWQKVGRAVSSGG